MSWLSEIFILVGLVLVNVAWNTSKAWGVALFIMGCFALFYGLDVFIDERTKSLSDRIKDLELEINTTEEEKHKRWMKVNDPEGYSTMLEIEYSARQAEQDRKS